MSKSILDRIDSPSSSMVAELTDAATTEQQRAILQRHYELRVVHADHDFDQEAVYFILGAGINYLVNTQSPPIRDGKLQIANFLHDKPMKPLDLNRLQGSLKQERIFVLQPRPVDTAARDEILDMGAFSQLVEAAQRSGLVPGVSTIVQVRDCEFRLGRYQQALQLMESLFGSFSGSVAQRNQRLAREESDIASGRVKMSPKDIQAKRIRDNRETEAIDRARTRFSRVVEGLRSLVQLGI